MACGPLPAGAGDEITVAPVVDGQPGKAVLFGPTDDVVARAEPSSGRATMTVPATSANATVVLMIPRARRQPRS